MYILTQSFCERPFCLTNQNTSFNKPTPKLSAFEKTPLIALCEVLFEISDKTASKPSLPILSLPKPACFNFPLIFIFLVKYLLFCYNDF